METTSTTKVSVISSDGDSDDDADDGIATTLPVIIQIKVKPDRRRQNKWRMAEAEKFAKNDERHRSERYRDDLRIGSELTAEYWRDVDNTRDNWQIFERKPSDQFNLTLRETLSKSLMDAVSAGSQATSARDLLPHSSDSECKCERDTRTTVADILSEIPRLPMTSHAASTASSRCSSVIEQKLSKPTPFSKVIEVVNPNGTLERDSARERMGHESNEKTGTFISARQSPKWINGIEQPNKWMRMQEKKINIQEPAIRAKPAPVKLVKRPKITTKNPLQLQSKAKAARKQQLNSTEDVEPSPLLDYRKIIDAFQYGSAAEKCSLLDALRSRLTKSKGIAPTETLRQFVANDLFQLKTNRLLPKLLWPLDESENARIQQNCVAALLNAIVSRNEGHKYVEGISMCDTLTANALGSSLIETNTRDNLIAVMAKLSIARFHRHDFMQNGLLDWLIRCLSDVEYSGSEYFFRNAFRLMLNLTSDPMLFALANDRTVELFTLIVRIYERPEQQPNREIIRKVLSNLHRCTDVPAKQINVRGIFMERIKKINDLTEKAALKDWLNEIAQKTPADSSHTFDKDITYNDMSELEMTQQSANNNGSLNGEAFLRTKFEKLKAIEKVDLTSRNEKSEKSVKSHRFLLPLLKHSFTEHTMDFRHISHAHRIFPKRKFPAVLDHEYRKLDFSTALDAVPGKLMERREHIETNNLKEEIVNRIPTEHSRVPFVEQMTSDKSQRPSLQIDQRINLVDPIIDALIKTTITHVHTDPSELIKLSESDSEIVVNEFACDSPPLHSLPSPVKTAKRSNIPIRIPPIETDLQALIKTVDDARKTVGAAPSDNGDVNETTAESGAKTVNVDSGDEKDVIIKLYNPEIVPAQRRRSSSLGSLGNIQKKFPSSKLCSKSDDDGQHLPSIVTW